MATRVMTGSPWHGLTFDFCQILGKICTRSSRRPPLHFKSPLGGAAGGLRIPCSPPRARALARVGHRSLALSRTCSTEGKHPRVIGLPGRGQPDRRAPIASPEEWVSAAFASTMGQRQLVTPHFSARELRQLEDCASTERGRGWENPAAASHTLPNRDFREAEDRGYRYNSLKIMARPEEFELPTPKFVVWCSIQLSYGRASLRSGNSIPCGRGAV